MFSSKYPPRRRAAGIAVIATLLTLAPANRLHAVINVGLQPSDLFERHENVVSGVIEHVEPMEGTFRLRVTAVHKGTAPAIGDNVTVKAGEAMAPFLRPGLQQLTEIAPGKPVAAFVGKRQRRRENELLFFAGGFFLGERTGVSRWDWTAGDSQMTGVDGQAVPTMRGTWNGSTPQLIRMLEDVARNQAHFPRRGYAAFKKDLLIDHLEGPALGVALYDLDGNGLPDVYACSPAGDRVYLQMEPLEFIDATEWLGLDQRSASVSFADYDLDGVPDLLAGARLMQGASDGTSHRLIADQPLPLADDEIERLHSSAFIEANGDGYPDVIIALRDGGLRLFLNPGEGGGRFRDATREAGLDDPAAGATGTGYFTLGDWKGDGRTDIFYAAQSGMLFLQGEDGRFVREEKTPALLFTSGEDEAPGLTGAGAFAPLLGTERFDLIVPVERGWHVIENREGRPVDVTEYGNEISEGSFLHLATVTADLNLDGHVDLYTVSRARNGYNRFIINRGYGSFMLGDVHRAYETMFDGPAQELGGQGVAIGDADGDGQPDILTGNMHGHLVLVRNDSLAHRTPVEHPPEDVAKLLRTGLIKIAVTGPRGVVGAVVRLTTATGESVGLKFIGGNNATGCREPDEATFATRSPGKHVVHVRYADGHERTWPVDIPPAIESVTRLQAHR